ncbi:hypothetical protein [uncultured Cedecea sp.]|uniref:hypothetical protein n=1 Tax=uncultured Cedecea sp. TaxID=988762 RepID=UPI00260CD4B7|nr:hypothetical protein [uncultured Cedecea sp.]
MTNQPEALIAEMKAAAEKAKQANELYLEKKITLSECAIEMKDYLDYSDNPKNVQALIAALEQSQQEKDKWVKWATELGEKCDRLEASQLAVKLPRLATVTWHLSAQAKHRTTQENVRDVLEAIRAGGTVQGDE